MQVFGHRGSPGFPRFGENTRSSFKKALAAGADGLEFDVRRCGDGTIVVTHDATIDRTTNGRGRVSSYSYDRLSRFDAGYGDPVPRLSDILDEFGKVCAINVELKETGLAGDVRSMIRERRLEANVIVSAFDDDEHHEHNGSNWFELSLLAPDLPVALLAGRAKLRRIGAALFVETAKRCGARAIHPEKSGVNSQIIDLARRAGLIVRAWTVNDAAESIRLRDLGVDAIFSDYPEIGSKIPVQ